MPSQETIDRNTRAVKDALKRDANRRCADCAARGPTIATIAFRTFVCQPCANAHRELFPNNKLKSVSLAEFETEEVRGRFASYLTVLSLNGTVLMEDTHVKDVKYEGLEVAV